MVETTSLSAAVRGRMPVLDGWRGIAILVVVFHNAGYVMEGDGSFIGSFARTALAAGWVGVTFFFVLSGFLITGILVDTFGSPGFFRSFYVRRTLRIFPLYYGFLAVVLVALPLFTDTTAWLAPPGSDQVWYWLYLSNWTPLLSGSSTMGFGHLWSLAVEEQFYLFWPILLFLVSPRRVARLAVFLIGATFAIRLSMFLAGYPAQYLYTFTIARLDALVFGALLAIVARQTDLHDIFSRIFRPTAIAATVGLIAIVVVARGFEPHNSLVEIGGQTLLAILFGLAMMATIEPGTSGTRQLAAIVGVKWLRVLGKYSYAVYIFHVPVHFAMQVRFGDIVNQGTGFTRVASTVSYCFLVLAASTLLAFASWHLFEKRFLALKDQFAPRPEGKPVV